MFSSKEYECYVIDIIDYVVYNIYDEIMFCGASIDQFGDAPLANRYSLRPFGTKGSTPVRSSVHYHRVHSPLRAWVQVEVQVLIFIRGVRHGLNLTFRKI